MIKIITSNTTNAGMNAVIDNIGRNDHTKGRHVVIVPDAHALSAEKVVFERLGLKGSMNIEVASFMRYAKKVLDGKIGYTLSKQGAVLFFKKVVGKVRSELVHYNKASLSDGFAGEMYAVIASIRNNGVTVEQFEESLLKLSGTTLNKAKDILLLYRNYLDMLTEFSDSTTRLETFQNEIAASSKIAESHFYIYGFDSLSEKQIDIIVALAKCSKGVTIALLDTNYGANRDLYPTDIIERLTYKLKESKIEIDSNESAVEVVKEPFSTLHKNLFAVSNATNRCDRGAVVLFRESSVYEQYNAVAREILRLVRREGLRFNDISVIDCMDRASTDFKEILIRYGIPFFMDERYTLTKAVIYKYIACILDVVRYGYRLDKVRTLIKNPLFLTDYQLASDFENYILSQNLSYDDYLTPIENESYEQVRLKLVSICAPFEKEKTVAQFANAITSIVESSALDEALTATLEGQDATMIALNEQAKDRIKQILQEYVKVLGDDVESASGFRKMLSASAEAEEIALIPRYIDAVFVGALRESCVLRQRAIFVIGATADTLPTLHGYQAIVSPLDMERLAESGVRLYPTPLDRIREERFALIDLVTKTEKLYFGYPEIGLGATQNKPSEVIKDVSRLLGSKLKRLSDDFKIGPSATAEEIENAVGSRENAFYTLMLSDRSKISREAVQRIYATLTDEEKRLLSLEQKGVEQVPLLYTFGDDLHSKVTQLEQYFACPYRHYLQFGLKLQERQEGVLRVADVGTFVHEVLERYFKKTLGKLRDLSAKEREDYADQAVSEVFDSEKLGYLTRDPSLAYLIRRLRRETRQTALDLTENVLKGSFDPTYIELEFSSREGAITPVKFHTPYGDVAFHGKIDRVDVAKISGKDVAIAIDYKTGAPKSEIHKVYYGEKLQLYLYLLVLRDSLGLKPIGSFYLPIKSGYFSKGRNYRFTGQMVLSEQNVKALDGETYMQAVENDKCYHNSDVIPINFKIKGGEVSSMSRKNKLTDDEMTKILEYVQKIIPIAIKEIGEGYIEKVPTKGTCDNCGYKAICGGAKEGMEREVLSQNTPLAVTTEEDE
ncbi:MAG: PD-(D/E)XK nuclease family protein [Clostridia bacterium]|nr:PD-(D/E)XK nuclease family protein [Clostridia bacterium]